MAWYRFCVDNLGLTLSRASVAVLSRDKKTEQKPNAVHEE